MPILAGKTGLVALEEEETNVTSEKSVEKLVEGTRKNYIKVSSDFR